MDTNTTESPQAPDSLFNPLSGWDAVSRWNAATFDMMTRAWQQWLALLTVVPPRATPQLSRAGADAMREQHAFANAEAHGSRSSEREAKPVARRESRRAPAAKPGRSKSRSARARG